MKTTEKILQALAYFAYKQPHHTIDPMKAYKLMWLADRRHLRCHGRTITGDTYNALPYGPVPTDSMNIIKGQETIAHSDPAEINAYLKIGKKTFSARQEPDMDAFSDTDIATLDLIFDTFGSLTAKELSTLSHEFPDWKAYENLLKGLYTKNSYVIDTDLFFENPKKTSYPALVKKAFSQSAEQLKRSQSIFHLFKGA